MTEPLPLVTATFTTDELAMFCAGLTLLRKAWAQRGIEEAFENPSASKALETVSDITTLINRVADMVSPDQGSALLKIFIHDLIRRHE